MINPYFSIIVPVYNRASLISRAINSCLNQTWTSFQLVVVDDGSTDETASVLKALRDDRLESVTHSRNRGRCAARNTGLDHALGKWIIFLDSDDELTPDALSVIRSHTVKANAQIGHLRFRCRYDDGRLSPDPDCGASIWEFRDFLLFLERNVEGRSEALICVQRDVAGSIRYPEGHSEEALYHFALTEKFQTMTCPAVVRLYHQDAAARVVTPSAGEALLYASDQARAVDRLLLTYGRAIRLHAPRVYSKLLTASIAFNLLAGARLRAVRAAGELVVTTGLRGRPLAALAVGLVNRKLLAVIYGRRAPSARSKTAGEREG